MFQDAHVNFDFIEGFVENLLGSLGPASRKFRARPAQVFAEGNWIFKQWKDWKKLKRDCDHARYQQGFPKVGPSAAFGQRNLENTHTHAHIYI